MNLNFFESDNNQNSGHHGNTSDISTNQTNKNEQISNISYTPGKDGFYNCFASSGYTGNSDVNMATPKKLVALFILVGIISMSFGFMGATFAFSISGRYNSHNYGETYAENLSGQESDIKLNVVPSRPKIETNEISDSDRNLLSISEVAATVLPSTVEIVTETAVYNQYFGSYVSEGAGSGVIISENGYIVTNHHVIENARTITVKLSSGNQYRASIVGADTETDIAVLSISTSEKLTPIVFGNSQNLVLGEQIVIIGNPLGSLGGSVTNGIISALDREITIDDQVMMLLQTNASVNPGNSGGGMFNMYGELVGIINAKSSGENIEGIGFAIPVNSVYNIASQIIEYGYVKGRVDHGLTLIEVEDVWDMTRYNVTSTGVYIYKSEFSDELMSGDRITMLNGVTIEVYSDIKKALLNCNAGDTVSIKVKRGNKTVSLELTLREYVPENSTFN